METSTATMQIFVNGDPRAVPASHSLADLISTLGLPPQTALVEQNGEAVPRTEWPERKLTGGDRLEILRIVAGG